MLSKEYLDTARTILRAAQTMTDRHVAGQLKALAEDYERRAEKAAHADAKRRSCFGRVGCQQLQHCNFIHTKKYRPTLTCTHWKW